jgi:hypothetical protein
LGFVVTAPDDDSGFSAARSQQQVAHAGDPSPRRSAVASACATLSALSQLQLPRRIAKYRNLQRQSFKSCILHASTNEVDAGLWAINFL